LPPPPPPPPTLCPYTTLFRSHRQHLAHREATGLAVRDSRRERGIEGVEVDRDVHGLAQRGASSRDPGPHVDHFHAVTLGLGALRSEEHTSELQSRFDLVCRLL